MRLTVFLKFSIIRIDIKLPVVLLAVFFVLLIREHKKIQREIVWLNPCDITSADK